MKKYFIIIIILLLYSVFPLVSGYITEGPYPVFAQDQTSFWGSPNSYSGGDYVNNEHWIKIHKKPSFYSKKLIEIPFGSKIKNLREESGNFFEISGLWGKWEKITWRGKTGWVFGGFLSGTKPSIGLKPAKYISKGKSDLKYSVIIKGDYTRIKKKFNKTSLRIYKPEDLRVIRNTIFARHGYKFKSFDLQYHFLKFKWYKASDKKTHQIKSGKILSKTDIYNIRMIKRLEVELITNAVYPASNKKITTSGGSTGYEFYLCGNKSVKFITMNSGQMGDGGNNSGEDTLHGKWYMKNNVVIMTFPNQWSKNMKKDIHLMDWKTKDMLEVEEYNGSCK